MFLQNEIQQYSQYIRTVLTSTAMQVFKIRNIICSETGYSSSKCHIFTLHLRLSVSHSSDSTPVYHSMANGNHTVGMHSHICLTRRPNSCFVHYSYYCYIQTKSQQKVDTVALLTVTTMYLAIYTATLHCFLQLQSTADDHY